MKYIVLFITLMIFVVGCADSGSNEFIEQQNQISKNAANNAWVTNLEDAQVEAAKQGKNILINFTGSDWCGWCKKLKAEVFTKAEFQNWATQNLILVEIDFPKNIFQTEEVKNYNKELARKYGVRGFPTIILLDKELKILGKTGYQRGGAANYIEHLKTFIK